MTRLRKRRRLLRFGIALMLLGLPPRTEPPLAEPAAPGAGQVAAAAPTGVEVLDVAGLQAGFAARRLRCEAIVAAVLARIGRFEAAGPAINALITVNPHALANARLLDRSPLQRAHCLPVVIKDNIDTADLPTTGGSKLFASWVPARDAALVERLRRAGAIVIGKSNLDDFAAAIYGISSLDGATRNPYAPTLTVGGSSGGSAAAVAAGYVPLAIGTDAGGSLRIPAALTGTVTIRPSLGLVSRRGIMPRGLSQDTAGPIARSVADAAAGLDLIAGRDPQDAATRGADAQRPAGGYAAQARPGRLPGARIGVVREGLSLFGGTDPAIAALLQQAVADLQRAGASAVELAAPPTAMLGAAALIDFESRHDVDAYLRAAGPGVPAASFEALLRRAALTPYARASFERERAADRLRPANRERYRQALAARERLRVHTLELFARERLDAIVYASTTRFAQTIGAEQAGVFTRWSENTGFPAIGVPMGLAWSRLEPAGHRLPANIEFLGRPFDEARLIGLAASYEAASRRREPPPLP